jgi:nucleotide-binding universal stress UspA family protein
MPIRSIVVAVDFGEASARAVAVGGALAGRCRDASLRLLHAESIEAPAYFTSEQIEDLERQRHTITSQAEQFLSRFGRHHTAVPFISTIDRRPPSEAIVAAAASADLVVMGTHGRHGLQRWWLGSVAERVLRETRTPLLVVRAPDVGHGATQTLDHLFDRIVVHAASPPSGHRALAFAGVLAACFEGVVSDERQGVIEPALERTNATLLAAAVPEPRSAAWTSNYGEPLLRYCTVPILFVPELNEGASP